MVPGKLSEAVGAVVQGFDVVRGAVPYLIRVVFDGLQEPLHFAVHEPTVRVDYGV